MSDQNEPTQLAMSNTKKEMMDAYLTVKQQLKAKEKQLLDAEKARKQMENQMAETTAETQMSQNPLQRLYDLRGAIGRELTSLAERFETEIDTYVKVQTAVKIKQEELNIIYGVETAASDLAALIEAHQAEKYKFNDEMSKKQEAFEEEMDAIHDRWGREKSEHDQQIKEQADAIKKQRQREKEEYEYAFTREKEQNANKLKDELQALEKEIEEKRKIFEGEFSQIRTELDAREATITKRESEIAGLEKEVETFPKRLEDQIKKAVAETTERITSDFKKGEALLNAKFDGERNVLLSKIEALEKLVKSQETQLADLSRKSEQAYEKVQDIANRAVSAARREYIAIPASVQDNPSQDKKNN
jgi:DNA repair exonuclease SbcCD ATPase subunit